MNIVQPVTSATYHGITHECTNPDCHVPNFIVTVAEQEAINELSDRRADDPAV